jgi:hypothetical protein
MTTCQIPSSDEAITFIGQLPDQNGQRAYMRGGYLYLKIPTFFQTKDNVLARRKMPMHYTVVRKEA